MKFASRSPRPLIRCAMVSVQILTQSAWGTTPLSMLSSLTSALYALHKHMLRHKSAAQLAGLVFIIGLSASNLYTVHCEVLLVQADLSFS